MRTAEIVQMGSGSYHYFGASPGLIAEVSAGFLPKQCFIISLSVNVDGLPISRRSRKQFGPIPLSVNGSSAQMPFLVALYEGYTKPENVITFMKDFFRICPYC